MCVYIYIYIYIYQYTYYAIIYYIVICYNIMEYTTIHVDVCGGQGRLGAIKLREPCFVRGKMNTHVNISK